MYLMSASLKARFSSFFRNRPTSARMGLPLASTAPLALALLSNRSWGEGVCGGRVCGRGDGGCMGGRVQVCERVCVCVCGGGGG
jgi:hypothetical protein